MQAQGGYEEGTFPEDLKSYKDVQPSVIVIGDEKSILI